MTYEWVLKESNGQALIGFHEIYETDKEEDVSCLALLYYFPQLDSTNNERIVHLNLFFVGSKQELTDGKFHWIHNDICELAKAKETEYFRIPGKQLSIIFSEVYFVDKLPKFEYYKHGDFGIESSL